MALAEPTVDRKAPLARGATSARIAGIHPAWAVVALLMLLMPAIANTFVLTQIFAWALILGVIALSLMFLAGYGGMVSLAQMTIAGFAGYMVAIFGVNGVASVSIGLPWQLATPIAIILAMILGAIVGALAVRTEGIYTIMITLAIAAAFFYFTNQNYAIFNGHTGINAIPAPKFWGVDWKDPIPFYYLTLAVAALCGVSAEYISRAPFGLALQGVRDNPRRMAALGFNVTAHRVAAYVYSALLAALGGILLVWLNGEIAPGTINIDRAIDILIIAVVGGVTNPIGAFVGAIIYVVLKTFAEDALMAVGLDSNRFRLLIGLGFLAIVFFSPDGVVGLWTRLRERAGSGAARRGAGSGGHG
jgi:branched-chain amino acid transport system permease protein